MRGRAALFFIVLLFSALLNIPGSGFKDNGKKALLNFLLITVDTLRADRLSCYSREHVETPNIDSLAERGFLFTRTFSHNSTTLPSHVNILLGTTPLYHGIHENGTFIVSDGFLTLAEHLKGHGYSTGAFIGAYPLDSRFGLAQGFDVYDDDYRAEPSQKLSLIERRAGKVAANAIGWLKAQESPWFLWIPLIISVPEGGSGQVSQAVAHTDIFPTVCDILGIETPSFIQGISLVPAIKGRNIPKRPSRSIPNTPRLTTDWEEHTGLPETWEPRSTVLRRLWRSNPASPELCTTSG